MDGLRSIYQFALLTHHQLPSTVSAPPCRVCQGPQTSERSAAALPLAWRIGGRKSGTGLGVRAAEERRATRRAQGPPPGAGACKCAWAPRTSTCKECGGSKICAQQPSTQLVCHKARCSRRLAAFPACRQADRTTWAWRLVQHMQATGGPDSQSAQHSTPASYPVFLPRWSVERPAGAPSQSEQLQASSMLAA
jgi:hypothetical protein